MEGIYERIPSAALGRDVHMWRYGWWGAPVMVFPSAAGFAHEWQKEGMIDTLAPLLQAGVGTYVEQHGFPLCDFLAAGRRPA